MISRCVATRKRYRGKDTLIQSIKYITTPFKNKQGPTWTFFKCARRYESQILALTS